MNMCVLVWCVCVCFGVCCPVKFVLCLCGLRINRLKTTSQIVSKLEEEKDALFSHLAHLSRISLCMGFQKMVKNAALDWN